MEISLDQLDELNCIIEDALEYWCDEHQKSGQAGWTALFCYSAAKQAEFELAHDSND
tara:strand:+ start:251 stop:421 length:171 start_codon:yes stop_codon:yes gene_type:complete